METQTTGSSSGAEVVGLLNDEMSSSQTSTTSSNGQQNNTGSGSNGNGRKTSITSPDPTAYVAKARVTRPTPPPPSYNPMQFVQIKPCNLYQTAQEQLKKAEEVKKIKEIKKEEPEDWQNNLDNWKSSRRKRVEHIIDRVVEVKKLELEEHDRSRRKSKTFSEMIEERTDRPGARGRVKLASLAVYNEDESNDLSDLGIGSASGKSSLSEDYDNNSVMSDNATELDKTSTATNTIYETKNHKNSKENSTTREYISSPGYDTSSSTAPASSPDPCEYTYEGAIQDYKQRVSRAAVTSGNSTTNYKLNSNGNGNGNGNDKFPTSMRNERDRNDNLNDIYPTRRGSKIEDRLVGFEVTSPSDSQAGVEKQKVDLPKIDITKRKEIFENQSQVKVNNEPKSTVTGSISLPKVTLRDHFKIDETQMSNSNDDMQNNFAKQKEQKRLSGDITSIRDRLQSLEQQQQQQNGGGGASKSTNNKIVDIPVASLKDRLSSLQNAVAKEEVKKPPVVLIDARQLEIMKSEEENAKQRMKQFAPQQNKKQNEKVEGTTNTLISQSQRFTEEKSVKRDDSGNHTADDVDGDVAPSGVDIEPEEQKEQLNAAIAALAIEEKQLEEAANAVNQIEAEFAELTDATMLPALNNATATTNDMEFSINEALELALEAIDKETMTTTTATANINTNNLTTTTTTTSSTTKIMLTANNNKNLNEEFDEIVNTTEYKKVLNRIQNQNNNHQQPQQQEQQQQNIATNNDNVVNDVDNNDNKTDEEKQLNTKFDEKNQMAKFNQKQKEEKSKLGTEIEMEKEKEKKREMATQEEMEKEFENWIDEPIYENIHASKSIPLSSSSNHQPEFEWFETKENIIPKNNKNNLRETNNNNNNNNNSNSNHKHNNSNNKNSNTNNTKYLPITSTTSSSSTTTSSSPSKTNEKFTQLTIEPKHKQRQQQPQQQSQFVDIQPIVSETIDSEPYYQVPKSSEPYYDAPKHLRPIPLYENIEIFYNSSGVGGNLIDGNSITSTTTANANINTILEPPKEKPPPPPTDIPAAIGKPNLFDEVDSVVDDNLDVDVDADGGDSSWSTDNTYETVSSRLSTKKHNGITAAVHPSPPIKRMNSTKRIKKELRNKRSSFLGIECNADDDDTYLELKVAPPPDISQLLQEERRLEKELCIKAGLCDSSDTGESRDSGVSENHSRQSSEHYTNSSEENDRNVESPTLHNNIHNSMKPNLERIIYEPEIMIAATQTSSLLQTVKGNSAESWTESATAAAAATKSITDQAAAKMLSIEDKIRQQEKVLRVEREILQFEQEELKRQRENLILRENMALRELQHGEKMFTSSSSTVAPAAAAMNRHSLQNLHYDSVAPSAYATTVGQQIQLMQPQQIYVNVPTPQQQQHNYHQRAAEDGYRKSMSDLNEFSKRLQLSSQQPPLPPTKPMRAVHITTTATNGSNNNISMNDEFLARQRHSLNTQNFGGSLVKIANNPTAAPRNYVYANYHHQQQPQQQQHQQQQQHHQSAQNLSSSTQNVNHGHMTRNTLLAISATPKPKYTDGWVQVQNRKTFDTNLTNDPAWLSAYQQKRKSLPDSYYAYNNHWLVQEAEQRRLNEQQQRKALSNGNTPLHQQQQNIMVKSSSSNNGGKPLPDSIIQTLTERVQNKGIGERKRFDYSTHNKSPQHTNGNYQQQQQHQPQAQSQSQLSTQLNQKQQQQLAPNTNATTSTAAIYRHSSYELPSSTTLPMTLDSTQQTSNNTATTITSPQDKVLSVSGKKKCSHCGDELGRGAAMIIESLLLFYHINCFKCCVCHVQLGDGLNGTDVRVRNHKLHCQNCYSSDDGIKFSCV